MKYIKLIFITLLFCAVNTNSYSQIIQRSGYIYTEIASKISTMPSDSGNHYVEPDSIQLKTWERTLDNLLLGNYSIASDSANTIGYNLVNFTDTFVAPYVTYYILETADTNYWGTYVYNPNYCRPLVIQAPHSKRDANTGLQGIHVFRKTEAIFYEVNGTHRCNSSSYSSCTGQTSSCSGTSEPYRISDLAHTTQSLFQKTTEVLLNTFNNTHFIQFHGFTKLSTDPYVILSNGTQQTPSQDYMSSFKKFLLNEDSVLTFKIAHIDTTWTRLRGFWNTQSRLVNASSNPCNTSATSTNGRFFHIEQERVRLRSNVSAWNKTVNALQNTFVCSPVSLEKNDVQLTTTAYPNPTDRFVNIEQNGLNLTNREISVHNLIGQNITKLISITSSQPNKLTVDLQALPSGLYLIILPNSSIKVYKTD